MAGSPAPGSWIGLRARGPVVGESSSRRAANGLSKSNPVKVESFRERLMASARLTNLTNALTGGFNLQTNGNGEGRGGTCSGDSGGPVFYGDTTSNVIVAVTSFGLNAYCRGVDFAYRTDQADVIAWILDHAPAGEAARDHRPDGDPLENDLVETLARGTSGAAVTSVIAAPLAPIELTSA